MINNTEEPIWPAAWPGSSTGQTGWKLPAGRGDRLQGPERLERPGLGTDRLPLQRRQRRLRDRRLRRPLPVQGLGRNPGDARRVEPRLLRRARLLRRLDGRRLEPADVHPGHPRPGRQIGRRERLPANPACAPRKSTARRPCAVPRGSPDPIGCISPCARFGTDRYCCRGKFAAHCSPARTWPIDYAKVFKRAEPFAYSWSGDDATSVFTCKGGCDYEIVFGVTRHGMSDAPIVARVARR